MRNYTISTAFPPRLELISSTQGANETSELTQYDPRLVPFGTTAWVICEIIHLTCISVALYLLYALLHYRAILLKNPVKSKVSRHRKGGRWLENLCLIGILFALLRFANNQALLFTGYLAASRCSVILNVSIAMYFIAIHPVYLFLWVRQRIFYSNRALKHLFSKPVRFLSWAALGCFIVTTVVSMVLFVVDTGNSASGRVCHWSLGKAAVEYTSTSTTTGTGTMQQGVQVNTIAGLVGGGIQTSFLALFLYPIMDNKLRAVRTKHLRSGSVGLLALIHRSFLLAGLCIVSDIAIALLVIKVYADYPDAPFAPLAMYDLNLIINLICIIVTFRRWRIMLFPWLYTDKFSKLCGGMGQRCACCSRSGNENITVSEVTSGAGRQLRRVLSTENYTNNMEKSAVSSGRRHSEPKKHGSAPTETVPNVLIAMMEIQHKRQDEEMQNTQSLPLELIHNTDSDLQPHSDSILPLSYVQRQNKRSSSLVVLRTEAPTIKQRNAKAAASLLAKTKIWILESKKL